MYRHTSEVRRTSAPCRFLSKVTAPRERRFNSFVVFRKLTWRENGARRGHALPCYADAPTDSFGIAKTVMYLPG